MSKDKEAAHAAAKERVVEAAKKWCAMEKSEGFELLSGVGELVAAVRALEGLEKEFKTTEPSKEQK